jgi:FkbM family methyltransferase
MPRSLADNIARNSKRSPLINGLRLQVVKGMKGRTGTVARGFAKGLKFNPGSSDSRFLFGTFEPAIQEFISSYLRAGMTFFDVGANVGFLSVLAARKVGPSGQVHCFEPLPQNAELIRCNAGLNDCQNIIVHEMALADADSVGSFRVSARPTFGALATSPMEVDEATGVIGVSVRSLDGLKSEVNLPTPDLIKLDIEGSEVDFFVGAEKTISIARPVVMIELHGTNREVARHLARYEYDYEVVGGGSIEQAPWAALVIATPREASQAKALSVVIGRKFSGR